jgi:hypothetical protein
MSVLWQKHRRLVGSGAVFCLLLWASMGAAQSRHPEVLDVLAMGEINWTTGVVQSRGWVRPATRAYPTSAQHRSAYMQAAQAARQRLLTTITQLRYDATQTVAKVLENAVEKQRRLEDLVAEAEVVQTRYGERGRVESMVQLSLFGSLTALLLPELPNQTAEAGPASEGAYTGIVVDARGLALQAALFPRLVDEQAQPVYDLMLVNAEIAARRGYIAYASAYTEVQARSRVGEHPLVIRARRVAGEARVDLVLRQTDALQIQRHDDTRYLLRQCRVIILI